MPVYNRNGFLVDSIKSVINQTYSNWELIVIDDCSTDKGLDYIRNFKDDRIRILENEANCGPSYCRNKGIRLSKGKYIAIQDSDDIALPQRLELTIKFLETNPEIDLISGGVRLMPSNQIHSLPGSMPLKNILLFTNPIFHSSISFRKESILSKNIQYDEMIDFGEDYQFYWSLLKAGGQFASLSTIICEYHQHAGQISKKSESFTLEQFFSERFLPYLKSDHTSEDFKWLDLFLRNQIYFTQDKVHLALNFFDEILLSEKIKEDFEMDEIKKVISIYFLKMLKQMMKRKKWQLAFKLFLKIPDLRFAYLAGLNREKFII
jgi:glycosyltransferase involved in cell wall biosynthesis